MWDLTDYNRFLTRFMESPANTISDAKIKIRQQLHVNLYDLLHWFRNPDTAPCPEKFASIKALGLYSYRNNKVFPRERVIQSYITSPLFRRLGRYWIPGQRGKHNKPTTILLNSASKAEELESSKDQKEAQSERDESVGIALTNGVVAAKETMEEPTEVVMASAKFGKGGSESPFALSETDGKFAPCKVRHGLMKKFRGARERSIKNIIPQ